MNNVIRPLGLIEVGGVQAPDLAEHVSPELIGGGPGCGLASIGGALRSDQSSPPYYGFDLVVPTKLRAYMSPATTPKLITVSAPPGYGKTTFLTQLFRNRGGQARGCIWVALDPQDRTVDDFLRLLEHAVSAPFALRVGRRPSNSGHDTRIRLEAVIGRLVSRRPAILFLENLHRCTDPELKRLLDTLIFGTGPQLQLVLSSRSEIPLDRGRATLELNAVQLDLKDLSFDAEAVASVLRQGLLEEPDARLVELVTEKSEGWPAAIRLMQGRLAKGSHGLRSLGRVSGSDADFARLFEERLLGSLEPDIVRFLLCIADLRIVSSRLVSCVVGDDRAAAWLRTLVDAKALVAPVDCAGTWFRFHGLFREFLVSKAAVEVAPSERSRNLERAARWCHENGFVRDAANYALSAPASDLARTIMDSNARDVVSNQGDLATHLDWVRRAEQLGIEIGIESEFWYAWGLALSRRAVRAQGRAEKLARRLASMPANEPGVAELTRRLALLGVMLHVVSDDMKAARIEASDWLQAERTRTPIYTMTAALAAATAMLPLHEFSEARRYIHLAQSEMGHIDGSHSRAWMATSKALLALDLGNPLVAEQILLPAHACALDEMGSSARMVALLGVLKARALCDTGRSEEARALLVTTMACAANQGFVDTTRHGLEAAVALGDGEESGPLGFATLEAIASDSPPRLRRMLAAAQIRRLSLLGEGAQAIEIAARHGFDLKSEPEGGLPSETLAINLARIDLLIANGPLKSAQKLAEQTLRQVVHLDKRRETVELHLTLARLHLYDNDTTLAVRSVSRAIALAAPKELVQPFMQQQKVFKEILLTAKLKDLALTLNEQINFFRIVSERTGATFGHPANAVALHSGDVGTLTHREMEMLALLESGPSNQQIADQLLVSTQTVKWHLYNLYAKLGVRNRAAALAKARSLSILSH